MPSSDFRPEPMARVAVVARRAHARSTLVALADAGVMEIDDLGRAAGGRDTATRVARDVPADVAPRVVDQEPDLGELRARRAWDLVAGEAELARRRADALDHGSATILVGWVPEPAVDDMTARLAAEGTSLVRLPRPETASPPTRMAGRGLHQSLRPLVETYAVVPYADVDPTFFAGLTYVLMFGMMFGDVGHGLVLALLGVWLARTRRPRFASIRRLWPFPVAAGLVAAGFGVLYGEAFGPTGWVPTLWLAPLDEPVRLLVAAVGLGGVLIATTYVIGTVNRWREGGWREALYASSGLAGVLVFLGGALLAGGVGWGIGGLVTGGAVIAGAGLVLTFLGLRAEAGTGATATAQATVEVFDTIIRIFANVVSFGRLAAFGLTHAAIGYVVWEGASGLWGPGFAAVTAVVVFVVGNAFAFALEVLVVGVQALRLEYYELFSRIFTGEGRLFEPWKVPIVRKDSS